MRFGEDFKAGQFERRVGDAGDVDAHQARGAEPVLALRGSAELISDPGDGRAHGALVGGLAFDAKLALSAFASIEALDHRAHEREVADVQLAMPYGTNRSLSQISASPHKRLLCGVNADSV